MTHCVDCHRSQLLDTAGRCRKCAVLERERIERRPAIARDLRRRAKQREYAQRPEVKARQRNYLREYAQRPEVKAKKRQAGREYAQRPEVKAKKRQAGREYAQRPEVKAKNRDWMREYMRRKRKEVACVA